MPSNRRNAIHRHDAIVIAVVAAISGVLATFAGAEPTGSTVPDTIVTFGLAAVVTWLGASAPWWALVVAGGITALGASNGPLVLFAAALLVMFGGMWLGAEGISMAALRAAMAGVIVQVALQFELDPFFLASALLAGVAFALVAITGWRRRERPVRKRVLWGAAAVGGAVVLAGVGAGVSGLQARSPATTGYREMLRGLELVERGDMAEASAALYQAALELGDAESSLRQPIAAPARMVPVLSQNVVDMSEVLASAADAAFSAAQALDAVDLDALQIVNGVIDIGALEALQQPLATLEATVGELQAALDEAQTPWLLGPLQTRLANAQRRADQVAEQAQATSAAARLGPGLLGADGPRHYLLMFTNPAEARGTSGLMGNWTELTITNGRLRVTDSGRTAELQNGLVDHGPLVLDASPEWFDRYGFAGAGSPTSPVNPKFWSNVTVSPDMASVGDPVVQMYRAATGRPLDGVFVIDPAGIAALLEITGPVTVPSTGQRLDSSNVEQFLILGQYEFVENEREDLLEAVTDQTVDAVLSSTLPAPQVLAATLAPAALEGHLSAYAVRADEQELLRMVGMDAELPRLDPATLYSDALAVVTTNASGNKIDSFLQRTVDYRPVYDAETGRIEAELVVTLANTAPSSGYADYVIGNLVGLPPGFNRTNLEIYTPLGVDSVTRDGEPWQVSTLPELGWQVHSLSADVPPGGSVEVRYRLSGNVWTGGYQLVYRPQALPRPDVVKFEARSPDGSTLAAFEGELGRRSVITSEGVSAWR